MIFIHGGIDKFCGDSPASEPLTSSRHIAGYAANPNIMLLFPIRLDCVVRADMP